MWVGLWVGGSFGGWVFGWVGLWVGGSLGRWVFGSVCLWVDLWVGESLDGSLSGWVFGWVCGWMGFWVGGSVGRSFGRAVGLTPQVCLNYLRAEAYPVMGQTVRVPFDALHGVTMLNWVPILLGWMLAMMRAFDFFVRHTLAVELDRILL